MDELQSIKQALSFLLEQENIRQQEIASLNEKIDALNSIMNERVREFSGWVDERDFKDFSDKYGERLSPYAEKMSKIHSDDYDLMRDVYDTYNPEEYNSEDEFIDKTIGALDAYLEDIGIPKDVAVEVRADMNGDGKPETVIDSTEGEPDKAEKEAEAEAEAETDEDKAFMDSINAAVDKELAKNK